MVALATEQREEYGLNHDLIRSHTRPIPGPLQNTAAGLFFMEGFIGMSIERRDNGWLKIGELPILHMVAVQDVVLHEKHDSVRVAGLMNRLTVEGILKNPPVVFRADEEKRQIVLDGANRITAIQMMGISHVVVQEVDSTPEGFSLESWHHAVEHLDPDRLLGAARAATGTRGCEQTGSGKDASGRQRAGTGGPEPDAAAFTIRLSCRDGRTVDFRCSDDLCERVEQLEEFTRIYHRESLFDRVSYTDTDDLVRHYPDFTALVTFSPFSREELHSLTAAGRFLPSGLTRVILPKRAMRLNLPLEVLGDDRPLSEKETWLQETIRDKVARKAIRFYREPTFFFDE